MNVRKESYMFISSGSDRVKKLRLKLMKNLKYFRLNNQGCINCDEDWRSHF